MNGKLLAFTAIFVESNQMDEVIDSLLKLGNVQEVYEVTGEFDIVVMVSAGSMEELRDILKNRIGKINGVKSMVNSIVLKTYQMRKCPENKAAPPAKASP